jgi:hypothetical protein
MISLRLILEDEDGNLRAVQAKISVRSSYVLMCSIGVSL